MVSDTNTIILSILGLLMVVASVTSSPSPEVGSPEVTLVVFGHTGNGKSSLCNTLIGDANGTSFKESPNPEEETRETLGKIGVFDGVAVFAVDTPGYGGGEGNTARYIVDMANYIANRKQLKALVVVLNYQHPRFDEDLRNFFQLITGMYPGQPWLDNLAVVWTRYFAEHTNQEERNARRKVPKKGIRMFIPDITEEKLDSIPQYFVDCYKARQQGTPDHEELAHLLAWAKTREPIGGNMRVKKGDPIPEEKEEVAYDQARDCGNAILQKKRTITLRRYRQEFTEGDPTYTEWKEVRSNVNDDIIGMKEPEGDGGLWDAFSSFFTGLFTTVLLLA